MAETTCAWCRRALPEEAPPIEVFATFRKSGRRGPVPDGPAVMVSIGPCRVAGFLARPGTPADIEGADISFRLCSGACTAALRKAMADDIAEAAVH